MYSKAVKDKTRWFIDNYGEGIIKGIRGTNIFFAAAVAQKAVESGWGQSTLTQKYNNWGGINCARKLEGVVGCIVMPTKVGKKGKLVKSTQNFSIFRDVEAGIRGVSKVLMQDRYKNARDNAKSAKEQILMFGKAGYGGVTPEAYLKGMSGIIEAAQDYSGLGRIY
jgi:flagellum-specific peptidoglycan hydrolase FlgJ